MLAQHDVQRTNANGQGNSTLFQENAVKTGFKILVLRCNADVMQHARAPGIVAPGSRCFQKSLLVLKPGIQHGPCIHAGPSRWKSTDLQASARRFVGGQANPAVFQAVGGT
jgi:hypothetical protein